MLSAKADKRNRKTLQLIAELGQRAEAAERYLVHSVAVRVQKEIVSRLPSGPGYESLRESFEVVRGNSRHAVYAVRSLPPEEVAKDLDATRTVVYVKAKFGQFLAPKDVRVLEKFSPWTLDTLPYAPDARYATLIHRRVSEREVKRVKKLRKQESSVWRRKLVEAGAAGRDARPLKLSRVRSVADTAFLSLNLEFGLGTKTVPHWRPALAAVRRGSVVHEIVRSVPYQAALDKVSFQGWKNWKRLGTTKISLSEMAKYQAFQDKLGLT